MPKCSMSKYGSEGATSPPAQESLFPKETGRSEGRVEQVRIVQGLPGGLNEQAIAAVEK